MEKKICGKQRRRQDDYRSKSDGEVNSEVHNSSSNSSSWSGRKRLNTILKYKNFNEQDEEVKSKDYSSSAPEEEHGLQKYIEETHTKFAYSLTKFAKPPYKLYLSTFRPLECPMPMCDLLSCPSALLLHLQQCHRELPCFDIQLDGSISSIDVYENICKLEPFMPTPVYLFKVNDGMYPEFPLILHMCRTSEDLDTPKQGFEDTATELLSGKWLSVWLTCLYIIPMWFRMQFIAYSPRPTSFSYVCKALETKNQLLLEDLSENNNVMLIHEKSLAQVYSKERSLFLEVQALSNDG